MSDQASPGPPLWVAKRDGRVVPFEADKISQALFAATEALGRPDAFLAREMADGVVHFLATEGADHTPTTAEIAELVVKVVRELGQPTLSEAFAECGRRRAQPAKPGEEPQAKASLPAAPLPPLREVLAACARQYTLRAVFTRDLAAAQEAGLLALGGLEAPDEIVSFVLPAPLPGDGWADAVEEARGLAAETVVVDGPEYGPNHAEDFVRQLSQALRRTGLRAVVNLNTAVPPSWAGDLAEGPLFAGQRRSQQPEGLAEQILHRLLEASRVRVDWHLGERDFTPEGAELLARLARLACSGAELAFTFDRPRRPVHLAEGVDRPHPAVLMVVGLHLPRLAHQPGVEGDPERFLGKLGSLARLALSAAVQKRAYLRQRDRTRPVDVPAVTGSFLLDRARLVVAPVGLDAVVNHFTQRGLCSGGQALEWGRRSVQRLREVLHQDGRAVQMATCLDGPWSFRLDWPASGAEPWPEALQAAGLTPWDATAPYKAQLRAGGVLHAAGEGGTQALVVPDSEPAVELLRAAWQQTEIVRIRFIRGTPPHQQLMWSPAGIPGR
jgi:hypothetical protein